MRGRNEQIVSSVLGEALNQLVYSGVQEGLRKKAVSGGRSFLSGGRSFLDDFFKRGGRDADYLDLLDTYKNLG